MRPLILAFALAIGANAAAQAPSDASLRRQVEALRPFCMSDIASSPRYGRLPAAEHARYCNCVGDRTVLLLREITALAPQSRPSADQAATRSAALAAQCRTEILDPRNRGTSVLGMLDAQEAPAARPAPSGAVQPYLDLATGRVLLLTPLPR